METDLNKYESSKKDEISISKLYHFLLLKGVKERTKAVEVFYKIKEINLEILLLRYGNMHLTVKEISIQQNRSEAEIIFRLNVIKNAVETTCGLKLEETSNSIDSWVVSEDEAQEHSKNVRKLLNSLSVLESDKIRKVIDLIYPRDFRIFMNLHPIFYDESIPINLLVETYKMTEEEIWRISDKIILIIQNVTGKTIPSNKLSDKNSSRNVVFTYNLKLKQLLFIHGVTDIGIIYRVSKAIVLKDLLIYIAHNPIDDSKAETVEEIATRLKLSVDEVIEAINRVDEVLRKHIDFTKKIEHKKEFKYPKSRLTSDVKEQRINNRRPKVQALLYHYGVTDKEKIDIVAEHISNACLIKYLYKLGMLDVLTKQEIVYAKAAKETRGWDTSISLVKKLLKSICGLEYVNDERDYSKSIARKTKDKIPRVRSILEYYDVFDEKAVEKVSKRIHEAELNAFLNYINLSSANPDEIANLKPKSVKIYISRVKKLLNEICGIKFEKDLSELPEELINYITIFMYNHGIRRPNLIREIMLNIGIEKLQVFISAVEDGQHHKKGVELGLNNNSITHYVTCVGDKIFKIADVKIETKYIRELKNKIKEEDSSPIGCGSARTKRKNQ